jgi:hypothetical protein
MKAFYARLFELLFDLLEYWRVRRIERRAGVRFCGAPVRTRKEE